jgi:hypothetical protein
MYAEVNQYRIGTRGKILNCYYSVVGKKVEIYVMD